VRYLVTGATGHIGRNLVAALDGADVDVYGRGDDLSGFRTHYDVVFHLAAEQYRDDLLFESNVGLTYRIISGVSYDKCIVAGSQGEYGRKIGPIRETDVLEPTRLHEATKAASSLLSVGYARSHDRDIVVVRPFSVYGPRQAPHKFIPVIIRSILHHEPITVYPGVHDWVYVGDFVEVLLTVAAAPASTTRGDIVHIGTGVETDNLGTATLVMDILGIQVPVRIEQRRFHDYDSDSWVADPTYAKTRYGIEARTALAEGLRRTCDHYRHDD